MGGYYGRLRSFFCIVIPAEAGIQGKRRKRSSLDPRLRRVTSEGCNFSKIGASFIATGVEFPETASPANDSCRWRAPNGTRRP